MKIKVTLTKETNAQRHKAPLGAVVVLDVEKYLRGVLPCLMDMQRAPMQAKCALAIAARSYAVRMALDGVTVEDGSNYQPYDAALAEHPPAGCAAALEATRGRVLTYAGHVIQANYCAANGGQTRRSSDVWKCKLPYYEARADPWDDEGRHLAAIRKKPLKVGHGVGLSLAGAEYAASIGEGCADILRFYYPGAEITVMK